MTRKKTSKMAWTPELGPYKPIAVAERLVQRLASPDPDELPDAWQRAPDDEPCGKIAPVD